MNYFEVKNLVHQFESIKVEASFSCEKNTMTCIVGASGSGKSTVLRMICGLTKPYEKLKKMSENEPKILLDGRDITELPPAKRQIGMVFQNHSLFNHLSVEENVAYGLISQGISKKNAKKQASDFLGKFGLEGFEKRYPETLSGGEAQRVCLARTLIIKPKIVLFDEPLSALDAPLRKKLAKLIKDLQKQFNFTGIMVTHDLEEAKSISDNILIMKKGQIIWRGKPNQFMENYLD